MPRFYLGLLSLVFVVHSSSVFAFGFLAHIGATRVAERHLVPEAKKEVDRLLLVISDKLNASFERADNTDRPIVKEIGPLDDSFLRASLYLDLIRNRERKTATWHYVNIPLEEPAYNEKYDKPRVHILSRVEDISLILFDRSKSDNERGEALLWLIHLVEDLHVPLHVCSNNDRGGNDLKLKYYYPGKTISQSTSLHAIWDYLMLDMYSRDREECFKLIDSFDTVENRAIWMKGKPVQWVNEGILLAHRAYRHPVEDRLLREDDLLDSRYEQKFLPEMASCCCKAGLRLAYVLNEGLVLRPK